MFLGTGSGFTGVRLTLPGSLAARRVPRSRPAAHPDPMPGHTHYGADQSAGLRDLTGDGIPDYVDATVDGMSPSAPARLRAPIESTWTAPGSRSRRNERCDGRSRARSSGLYDVDGDGKPEVVPSRAAASTSISFGGALPGNARGRASRAGRQRLRRQDDHRVPLREGGRAPRPTRCRSPRSWSPRSRPSGPRPRGALSAVRYAYGGAELMFDPVLEASRSPATAAPSRCASGPAAESA